MSARHASRGTIYLDKVLAENGWTAAAVLLLASSCLFSGESFARSFVGSYLQAVAQGDTTHTIDIDNDSLLLTRKDGFYSSGLRYTRQYETREGEHVVRYGWRLGQELYTASDIKLHPSEVAPNDHPYAGWLYTGMFKQTVQADGVMQKWGVDLGCLGPCANGERTQTALHRILQQPLPQGWAGQVKNEWGVVLYGEHAFAPWRWGAGTTLTPALHGRFGNIFTDAGAALTLRSGQLHQEAGISAAHAFLRLDGRLVAYNATLQGGYFSRNNPHTVSPERWVGEAEAGIAWKISSFALRLSVIRRSNVIGGLTNAQGGQNIGSLKFSYSP